MPENEMPQVPARRIPFTLTTPIAIVVGAAIIGVCLMIGLSYLDGGSTGATVATQGSGQRLAKAANIKDVRTAGEPYIGNANAPVVMAFWSDYQCPYCKAWEVGGVSGIAGPAVLPALMTQYVNTGKLKIVFKDFAFLGNDSTTAAEYGRAIWHLYPAQFFAWRTAMYVAQDQEGDQGFGNAATIDQLIRSKFPKIDDAKIKADITSNKSAYDAAIQADFAEGGGFGITGTPGFITGTKLVDGDQPLSAFTAVIDPQLK